jgi:hypothetical protein
MTVGRLRHWPELGCLAPRSWTEFFAAIDRIKTKSPLERLSDANKIGELPEWTTEGIFERLKGGACKQ